MNERMNEILEVSGRPEFSGNLSPNPNPTGSGRVGPVFYGLTLGWFSNLNFGSGSGRVGPSYYGLKNPTTERFCLFYYTYFKNVLRSIFQMTLVSTDLVSTQNYPFSSFGCSHSLHVDVIQTFDSLNWFAQTPPTTFVLIFVFIRIYLLELKQKKTIFMGFRHHL